MAEPVYKDAAEEAAWREAMRDQAKRRNRSEGLKTPRNIIARPIKEPRMVNVKDGEVPDV